MLKGVAKNRCWHDLSDDFCVWGEPTISILFRSEKCTKKRQNSRESAKNPAQNPIVGVIWRSVRRLCGLRFADVTEVWGQIIQVSHYI